MLDKVEMYDPFVSGKPVVGYAPQFLAKLKKKRKEQRERERLAGIASKRDTAARTAQQRHREAESQQRLLDMSGAAFDQLCADRKVPDRVRDIISEVATKAGLMPIEITGQRSRRQPHIVIARSAAMYLVKQDQPNRSAPVIAKWFGADHTSVLNNLARHQNSNPDLPRFTEYCQKKRPKRVAAQQP